MPDAAIHIGELRLIPHRELRRGDAVLPIGGRALALLSELAAAAGELVGKDRLFERVWAGAVVEDNALQAQISQLRKIMGAEAARLVAVHGRGYRLAIDTGSRVPSSVAVLPFADLTGDPAMAYLGEGMAEELLVILSRASRLRVPSLTSSFAYRGRDTDLRTIARDLGVEAVLEGSVRTAGERIRVTAQLIEAETGFHLWSENYDRQFGDLLALQDEIAAAIALALKTQLGVEQPRTPDLEAHRLYLRVRALCEAPRRSDLLVAHNLLNRAIERDPDFAKAHAQRALCVHLGITHGAMGPERHREIAPDAERALALDPQLSWAHMLHGLVRSGRCDWRGAEESFTRSFSGRGNFPAEHSTFAYHVLAPLGRIQDSIDHSGIACKAAPAAPTIAILHAMLNLLTDMGAARESLKHALALGFPPESIPASCLNSLLAWERADAEAAIAGAATAFPAALQEIGALRVVEQTYRSLAGEADRDAAVADLKALFERSRQTGLIEQCGALYFYAYIWFTLLGALDEAYAVADALVGSFRRTGYIPPPYLLTIWWTCMRPFREDPRFDGFVRALKMFEYWERHGPPDGYDLVEGKLIAR